jgi:hypothetical protein
LQDGSNFFLDYKTTSGKVSEFPKAIFDFGYDISAAFYSEGKKEFWREHYGDYGTHKMFWLVQEVNPPYDWAIFSAEKLMDVATTKFYDLLEYHRRCMTTKEYPGIASLSADSHGIFFPEIPPWKSNFNPLIKKQ